MERKKRMSREEQLRKHRERQKVYRAAHPERLRAERKRYRETHMEEVRAWNKAWCERHPQYQKEYYAVHRKRLLAQQKAWRVQSGWKPKKKKPLTLEQKMRKRLQDQGAYQRLSPEGRLAKLEAARQYRMKHKEKISAWRNAWNAEKATVQKQMLPAVFEQIRRKLMRKSLKALQEGM